MTVQKEVESGVNWIIMALIVAASWGYNQMMYRIAAIPFDAIAGQAAQLCAAPATSGNQRDAYRTGKVLLIDASSGRIHDQFRKLDKAVRAQEIGDVGMIVCLEEIELQVSKYPDGGGAYQIEYRVWTIDFDSQQAVGARIFWGSEPPPVRRGRESGRDNKPFGELDRWLVDLPMHSS
jgi:hypothetical protein